ncbi:FMN reductase [Microbacteriaceae bacterium SG_E_30_P1]|uniref:FMN reductase n=1 Tax=Antiquaquibacter oligotrophicus TaxID=2880260 RepID=A0ABT6KS86_9MICO|nr:FMN reductase [Antiquaquibacter oligotrophicus]MDH6182057.1 FMN reductase [Antiquaquibacter oligotrophicus]UDF12275.1 FMN reductase [Antiquaquibacter oligotrophicus]
MSARPLKVVAVCGSLQLPSKSQALLDAIVEELGEKLDITTTSISLTDLAPTLAGSLSRSTVGPQLETALREIESAELLVVVSPVYRAAFSGLFKHLFDLVDQRALEGTPVLLAATGGSERHSLILEHHLRPLFSFFQAVTLPLGVYGVESDFVDYRIASDSLRERVERVVERAVPLIRHIHPEVTERAEHPASV